MDTSHSSPTARRRLFGKACFRFGCCRRRSRVINFDGVVHPAENRLANSSSTQEADDWSRTVTDDDSRYSTKCSQQKALDVASEESTNGKAVHFPLGEPPVLMYDEPPDDVPQSSTTPASHTPARSERSATEMSQISRSMRAVPSDNFHLPPLSEKLLVLDDLLDFGLNVFHFQQKEICIFFVQVFQYLGLQFAFGLRTSVITRYAIAAKDHYRMVPYHNITHAFSITQFLFATCTKSAQIRRILGSTELLAIFAAAPVHDIDHPGNNNAFEEVTKSGLALRYRDTSVLENHHAAIALGIMKYEESDVFGTLPPEQAETVREIFVHAILQTDMAQHFTMVDQLRERLSQKPSLDKDLQCDRRYLVGCLLHSVDISNPLLPDFELSRKWAERINEEFLNQYRNELALGLPQTKMWAELDTAIGFYKSQLGFLDYIVAPIWQVITEIFIDLEEQAHLCGNLADNRTTWHELWEEQNEDAVLRSSSERFYRVSIHHVSVCHLPLDGLLDFGLNSFGFGPKEMCAFYVQIIQFLGCQAKFDLQTVVIMRFIGAVRHRYQMVPYHNLTHAFSITQFLFAMCHNTMRISETLTDLEVLALFVAAPLHDIDHPGNNNAWEVATRTELAVRYQDLAVLENHHAALGLELMKDSGRSMFGTLDRDELELAKELFTYTILQTDMARHSEMVDTLKALRHKETPLSPDSFEDRRYLLGSLLHSVDLSNPLLPSFELTRKWAERINEEFMNQYKNEIKMGLPGTPMWANLNTNYGFYKDQIGFIDFVVAPLWIAITDIFESLRAEARANLEANKASWLKLVANEEREKLRT